MVVKLEVSMAVVVVEMEAREEVVRLEVVTELRRVEMMMSNRERVSRVTGCLSVVTSEVN